MKYTIRKITALIVALMLAMPGVVTADETIIVDGGAIVIDDVGIDIGDGLGLALDGDAFTVEDFDGLLTDGANGLVLDGLVSNLAGAASAAPAPFEQTVRAGDVAFTVAAEAGAFPEGASLRVSDILDETLSRAATDAAEAIMPGGVKQHRLYQIEVIDRDGNLCPMNAEMALPSVRVEGLDVGEAARMVYYDPVEKQGREIVIEREEGKVIRFGFTGSGVYDVVEIAEETSSPTDVFTSGDVDAADESDEDDPKPSPVGEGTPTALDEVPSPADSDTTGDIDLMDDQKPSPVGEGGEQSEADEVPSPADSDTTGESSTDDQKPSPRGEGAEQSEADEVSPDSQPTVETTGGEAEDEGTPPGASRHPPLSG